MTESLRSARLTIVDFMGVLLPGAIWTLLILTYENMLFGGSRALSQSPIPVARQLTESDLDASMLTGLLLLSLLLGYVVKALSSKPVEFLANPSFIWKKLIGNLRDDDLFPYAGYHRKKDYFHRITGRIDELLGCSYRELSGYQPFELCKRFLKLHASPLWEEVQAQEALVRFLTSLSLATLASTILGSFAWVAGWWQNNLESSLWLWPVSSLIVLVILLRTFRKRRRAEVNEVYMSTLLTLAWLEDGSQM